MPTPVDPAAAGLSLVIEERGGKTMTRHRMGADGILTFRNASAEPLVITCRSHAEPFLEEGCSTAVGSFTVSGNGVKSVRIAPDFDQDSFTYSARIGDHEPEDPIVIVDRR